MTSETPTTPTIPLVKLFVAILGAPGVEQHAVVEALSREFGPLDYQGEPIPFDVTRYYEAEMSADLSRQLVSFTGPHYADSLPWAKLTCMRIEQEFAIAGRRRVNLDAGYLDHNKVVLASTKEAGQKVYLTQGIYADLAARYSQGEYRPFEWSFPDFKDGRYTKDLLNIRRILKGA
jgi:hypothetical protein